MPENDPIVEPRIGANDKARIAELERVVKMLLNAIKAVEDNIGETAMPEGTFYGVEFKD